MQQKSNQIAVRTRSECLSQTVIYWTKL